MNFQPITTQNAHIRMLICGESGAGKTHLARTLNPATSVVVLTESKALPLAGTAIPVSQINEWPEFEAFLNLFDENNRLYVDGKRIKNLFFDSLSELSNMLHRQIVQQDRRALTYQRMEKNIKEKNGVQGPLDPFGIYPEIMTMEDFNLFERRFINAMNRLCDMEINVFCTVRVINDTPRIKNKDGSVSVSTVTKYAFDIPGKTKNSLGSHFDLIAYIRRDPSDESGRARLLDFTADFVTVAKGHMDLPLVIPADLKAMQQALFEAGRENPPTS